MINGPSDDSVFPLYQSLNICLSRQLTSTAVNNRRSLKYRLGDWPDNSFFSVSPPLFVFSSIRNNKNKRKFFYGTSPNLPLPNLSLHFFFGPFISSSLSSSLCHRDLDPLWSKFEVFRERLAPELPLFVCFFFRIYRISCHDSWSMELMLNANYPNYLVWNRDEDRSLICHLKSRSCLHSFPKYYYQLDQILTKKKKSGSDSICVLYPLGAFFISMVTVCKTHYFLFI